MDNELIKSLINDDVRSIKPIHAGVSNSSYLVNDKLVVRIKENKEHFYSSKKELSAMKKVKKLGISEKLISLDKNGNKVSEYIKDIDMFTQDDEKIIKTAIILKKLHSSKIHTFYSFKPFVRYKYYKKNASVLNDFRHEEIVIKKTHEIYHRYRKVLCHNDIVDNNLLFIKDKTYLIDYEFASKNIPLFDLASFISENNITDIHKIELFLKTYNVSDQELKDLPYMIMFLNLLWFYWAKLRYKETKKEIYKEIYQTKERHIHEDMRSLLIFDKKKNN